MHPPNTPPDPPLAAFLDNPAHEALRRSEAGLLASLAPGLGGLGLFVGATALGAVLAWPSDALTLGLLRATAHGLVLALLVGGVGLATVERRLMPRSVLALASMSLALAGVATALVMPLVLFLWLCTRPGDAHVLGGIAASPRALIPPLTFLFGSALLTARIASVFDERRGAAVGWLVACAAALGFWSGLPSLSGLLARGMP